MQNAIDILIIGSRYATPAWLLLATAATAAFLCLSVPAVRQRRAAARAAARAQARLAAARRGQLAEYARQLRRYAEEIAVAAERADGTAQRRRAEWTAAHRTAEAVWRAYDQAEVAARRLMAAAAYRLPAGAPSPDEIADRRRYLERAAAEAHRCGEFSSEQYADVLLHRRGWSPRRHPADLELMLRQAAAQRLFRAYRTAAAAERTAWDDAELAAASTQELRAEAHRAASYAASFEVALRQGAHEVALRQGAQEGYAAAAAAVHRTLVTS